MPPPIRAEGKDWWVVEEVLGKRFVVKKGRRVTEYLIKWKDFPESENSWEPSRLVYQLDAVKDYNKALEASTQLPPQPESSHVETPPVQEELPLPQRQLRRSTRFTARTQ